MSAFEGRVLVNRMLSFLATAFVLVFAACSEVPVAPDEALPVVPPVLSRA